MQKVLRKKYSTAHLYILLASFLLIQTKAFSQESLQAADSISTSIEADSAITSTPKGQFEGPVNYWAKRINLSDDGNLIDLKGNAKIIYQSMTLTAENILIDQHKKTLYARGVTDSLDADSNLVLRGTPIFSEQGQEPLRGNEIEYNFDTKRGKILVGKTEMEPGYYRGTQINRIADSTMLICDGIFTSCEYIDNPHFYFQSDRIRMKVKDKVVVKPIVFYIADVPLAWLPFGIFPNKRGRHSGIVIPKYGESRVGGRFLREMGYYWAPNDYFDASFLADYYDRLGFAYRMDARYTVRYSLNGSFSGEYYPKDPSTGSRVERWRLRFNHSHNIDPTMSIRGSGSFTSDKQFARQLSANVDDRLNQNVTSNLTLNKRWKGTKNSMSVSISSNENLQTGTSSYTLPSVTFNRSQSSIYEMITGKKLGSKRAWYQNVNMSYNSNLIRRGSKSIASQTDTTTIYKEAESQGIQHRLSFASPQKFLKYFNLTPSMSYKEVWVDEVTEAELNPETNLVEEKQKKQFAAQRTFDASIGAKTTLYGMFEPGIGKLKYIRHKLDPSVSLTYRPDFSSTFYGYYKRVKDSTGADYEYDQFKKSPFGGTSRSESQRMSISLGNLFQGKMIDDEGKEKKIDLLTMNFSSSYDFLADSLRWSNISSNFRTKIFNKNISVRTTHTMYKLNNNNRQIEEFNGIPKLLTVSTSMGFSLSNKTFAKKDENGKGDRERDEFSDELEDGEEKEGILNTQYLRTEQRDYEKETKNIKIPWQTSFNFDYSYDKRRTDVKDRFGLSARANFQLTKNWKISWNARFDLVDKEITSQSFNIFRDLHCWEMSFGWQPEYDYYDFQINIKASALKDIKLTKHPSGSMRY